MNLYAFDVDDTLELSDGPISIASLRALLAEGHILGLCGNYAVVTQQLPDWHRIFSFLGPMEMSKASFLSQLAAYVPADEYILVGNDPAEFGVSDDRYSAWVANWRFIREHAFAAGER
jgi:hypothetical protein